MTKSEQAQELANIVEAARIYEQNFGGGGISRAGSAQQSLAQPESHLMATAPEAASCDVPASYWFQGMGYDEYIYKRELRESAEGLQ